jgi:RNA polymerase sigma factor (sigma-70 family)
VSGGLSQAVSDGESLVELVPVVRRIVGSRIQDPHVVDDLVQETLARVMAARSRVEGDTLAPYATTTARNLVASYFQSQDLARRKAHLLADEATIAGPVDELIDQEDKRLMTAALERLPASERDMLIAHEVKGYDMKTLATRRDSTPGAVAAALGRIRAKLRVEYVLLEAGVEPTSDRCRPVLRALSAGDRRRQRELEAGAHILECEACARVSPLLLDRRIMPRSGDHEVRITVNSDADVVTARQKGREVAVRLGFSPTDATLLATAISEMARNVVKFAERGQIQIFDTATHGRDGVSIVVRDVGPGIPDLDQAMRDGFSTYNGLGLGLPGARRLMDEFDVVTEEGRGTTITMTKWRSAPDDTEDARGPRQTEEARHRQ